jgi:hypothetical protein
MSHLEDKLADFFYSELPPVEMANARRHVEECPDCRQRVGEFAKVDVALKTMPDCDPPGHIVIAPPRRRVWTSWFDLRSALAGSVAAALVAAVTVGLLGRPSPVSVSLPAPAPVVVQSEKIDYNRIVDEVRQSERVWLANELTKRDQEIGRLRGELAYYENFQRAVVKETLENGSAIQLLAQRTESQR